MLTLNIGPLALPVAPLVLWASVWLAAAVARRWLAHRVALSAGAHGPDPAYPAGPAEAAGTAIFVAAGLGLLAARLAHVGLNASAYLDAPLAIVDVRDGGWHAVVGFLVGLAWLLWRAWRRPAWRQALAAGVCAGCAVWGLGTWATGPAGGAPLPSVALTPLGETRAVTLREVAVGRPAVVNLWASWCGPCRQEMPVLADAQQREASVAFVFVNQGESEAAVRSYLSSLGRPLQQVLLDPRSQLGPLVGSGGLPTTLFYDAQGRLVHAHLGVLNAAALAGRLRALREPGR